MSSSRVEIGTYYLIASVSLVGFHENMFRVHCLHVKW